MAVGGQRLTATWAGPRPEGRPVVVTGVFDVLHIGHVRFLRDAAERGFPVVVGVESDDRVRAWKGPGRPVNPAAERAEVLCALRSVAGAFVISGPPGVAGWRDYADLLAPLEPVALGYTAGDPHTEAKRLGAEAMGAQSWEFGVTEAHSTSAMLEAITSLG
ncbi:cytidyltransferase [Actinomadura logoneensis]|uniref:Cytidyltransferase n=1 Tax=Actinomadura logoneensis TaxID=2293572 RepID=A0A372JLU4_9ACTN|nr:adenylyltransferase/cytidyltransferase family protein [Actinomadura logoneensis]RFU41013.1 cytidyltransferase [Actinomadura logoneensis]